MGVTAALTAASAGLGAIGSLAEGSAAAEADAYNAAVARNFANYSLAAGQSEEQAKRMQTNALIGSQKAEFGASGFDSGSGSSAQVIASSKILGELDALTIRSNARAKAASYMGQATLYDMQESSDRTAGYLGAFKSILGGATSFADKWSTMNQTSIVQ